jgi:hypothetical protein
MKKLAKGRSFLVFCFSIFISLTTFAEPVQYVGAGNVVGTDGVTRCIKVSMTFESDFNRMAGTPPPGYNWHDAVGHFQIYTYLVEVEGLGVFSGANGRLNIWLDQTPTTQQFYTEELEVLEYHNLMRFYDGSGNPFTWSSWLGDDPEYSLAPELVITRLNIAPGYSFDFGNDIHLHPLPCECSCDPKLAPVSKLRPQPSKCSCKCENSVSRLF